MPYALRALGPPVFYTDMTVSSVVAPTSAALDPFHGGTIVPVVFPTSLPQSSWYMANGALLDSQPTICTAPFLQGGTVPAGSIFVLLFATYTANTQTHLADGSTVSMQFLVYGGNTAIGMVGLASSVTNGVFQVTCTVLSPIPISI